MGMVKKLAFCVCSQVTQNFLEELICVVVLRNATAHFTGSLLNNGFGMMRKEAVVAHS
jgi:hypothetical protein